jgi:secreted trypsin-like serine protease
MEKERCVKKPIVIIGLVAAACGAPERQSAIGSDTVEIVQGVPTTETPSVVALYGTVEGREGGALCTATVVSPTVVLTAAHCVHPQMAGDNATFVVFTSHDITDPATRGTPLKVREVHYNPTWDPQNLPGGHDIAVAILEDPTDIAPMPVNLSPLTEDLRGAPARIIGYGLDDGIGQTGAGVKRHATVALNSWDEQLVNTGSWFGQTICNGDSGGPILMKINGVETVVGVNSFGLIFCLGEASSTRPDANLDFLDQYLN